MVAVSKVPDTIWRAAKGLYVYATNQPEPFHHCGPLMTRMFDEITKSKARTFIETGTFRGDSLRWVAEWFPSVECHSVDLNPAYAWLTALRLVRLGNVHCHQGDSEKFLRSVLPKVQGPIVFWLDAHWTHGFPLNREVAAITELCRDPIIFVDDWKGPPDFDGRRMDLRTVPALASMDLEEYEVSHFCIARKVA